jgi:hypothetical protein
MYRLAEGKIIEIFRIADDFRKEYSLELSKLPKPDESGRKHRNHPCEISDSEIITVLLPYHFGIFNNFKYFYMHYIRIHLHKEFPKTLSYSRFIQIELRVFAPLMFFLNTVCFGKCVLFL